MNNSEEPKKVIVQKFYLNGLVTSTVTNPDSKSHANKTPHKEQKKRSKRCKGGISQTDRRYIESALFLFKEFFGIDSIRWMILTYSHEEVSNEAIANIAQNWTKIKKSLTHQLNNTYSDFWVVSIGLQIENSKGRELPCYDINIAVVDKGEKVAESFIKTAYGAISKAAKETIKPPLDIHNQLLYNTDEDFEKITRYLSAKQASEEKLKKLERLQKKHPDEYFPKSWAMFPKNLKEACKPLRNDLDGDNLKLLERLVKRNWNGVIELLPKHSNKRSLIAKADVSKINISELKETFKNAWNAKKEKAS